MRRAALLALCAGIAGSSAGRAFAQPPAAALGDAVAACAAIASDRARLSCYDGVARADEAAETTPARDARAADSRTSFGLPEAAETPERIEIVVAALAETQSGTARFTTEDGQVWEQTSARTRRYAPVPFAAVIETGAANSYFLTPEGGGLAVRVRRLR